VQAISHEGDKSTGGRLFRFRHAGKIDTKPRIRFVDGVEHHGIRSAKLSAPSEPFSFAARLRRGLTLECAIKLRGAGTDLPSAKVSRPVSAICHLIKAAGILLRDVVGVSLPVLP